MQVGVGLLVMDVMPIRMIIALDIVITLRFSINCSTVICLPTVCFLSREKPLVKPMASGFIFYTYLYQISLLFVTVKGLTTPFSCCVQVFVSLCRCIY